VVSILKRNSMNGNVVSKCAVFRSTFDISTLFLFMFYYIARGGRIISSTVSILTGVCHFPFPIFRALRAHLLIWNQNSSAMSGRANKPPLPVPSSEEDEQQPGLSLSGRPPPAKPGAARIARARSPPLASSHPRAFPFNLTRIVEPRLTPSTFNSPTFRPFGAAQAPQVRPPNLESGHPIGCPPVAAQAGPPTPSSPLQPASILRGPFSRSTLPVQTAPESDRRAGPQFAGGTAPQFPGRTGPQFVGAGPQSSAGAGPNFAGGIVPQYGGGAGLQRPMDPFRLWLKSEMTTAAGTVKGFTNRLAAFDSDDMRETRARFGSSVVSEYRRRCRFMIDDAKARYKKCREEFVYSYQSAIRDCGYNEYTCSYCPRINEVLQNEDDPRTRLQIFRAMESSLFPDDSTGNMASQRESLIPQLELAMDEELRIISGAAHLESTTTPRTIHRTLSDDLASAAQGRTRGTAQTVIGYLPRNTTQDSPAQDTDPRASDPAPGEVTNPPSAIPVPNVPAAVSVGSLGGTQATGPSRKRSTPEVPAAPRAGSPARSEANSPRRKRPTQGHSVASKADSPARRDAIVPPKKRSNQTRSVDTARTGAVEFRPARVDDNPRAAAAGAVPGIGTRIAAAATLHARCGSSGAGPSQAGPSQAGPSQAGPSQAGPSQADPSQAGPSRSSGAGPSTAKGRPPGVGPAGPSNRY
jgi:hypothetical protein